MQIGEYPAYVLLQQSENAADVEAGAEEEAVHEAECEHSAGPGCGQQHVGDRKQGRLDGECRQSGDREHGYIEC